MQEIIEKYEKAITSLTPRGSEFVNDPEYCAKHVKEFQASQHKLKYRTSKRTFKLNKIMSLKSETGKALRKARKEKKLTIRDLSDQSKVNFNYLGNIERGKVNTTLDMIEKLAETLNKKATINFE